MKLISHRGNVNGVLSNSENTFKYIEDAITMNYDVEIDVWYCNDLLFLGHDNPELEVGLDWLLKLHKNLFVHTKNIDAFNLLRQKSDKIKIFFHESERHVPIINSDLIWTHDLTDVRINSIIPLLSQKDLYMNLIDNMKVIPNGVCSDFIEVFMVQNTNRLQI